MSQPRCQPIDCVFNEKLKKGMCIGVAQQTLSFEDDVVRLCAVTEKPVLGAKCKSMYQYQMTPREADRIGMALIKTSLLGDTVIRQKKMAQAKTQAQNPNPTHVKDLPKDGERARTS